MNIIKYFLGILAIMVTGCTKFVELDPPNNQMLTANVFDNDETATAALLDIYIKMFEEITYSIPVACGFASDELTRYATGVQLVDLYANSPRPSDAYTNTFWNRGFFYIYQANSIMEGVANSDSLNPKVQKQLMAEAQFIRAFWMYYLVNFFGDIPLILTTDYNSNSISKRTNINDIYKQIISDLQIAEGNLNPHYIDGNSRSITNERVRPNQSTARALLARVYLATGNWSDAEQLSDLVIETTNLYDTVSINKVFLKDNKEAIWQLLPPLPRTSDLSTREAYHFILVSKPTTSVGQGSTISPQLLSAFEVNDLRRENWIGKYVDVSVNPNQNYFYPYKYKVTVTASPITEQSTVLRLAEQYLIRAEARTHLGNFEGALHDINIIRERARLNRLSLDSKESILRAILKERQIEFFTEWGHRWIDIKRMGYADEIMPNVLKAKQGGQWASEMKLWPIPQTEIDRNKNLKQNDGYN